MIAAAGAVTVLPTNRLTKATAGVEAAAEKETREASSAEAD